MKDFSIIDKQVLAIRKECEVEFIRLMGGTTKVDAIIEYDN
jgi:hypothetical protein